MYKEVIRPKPIYLQVADQIEKSIIVGVLQPGNKFPGERELAVKFNVSRRTLREALRLIEQKGLIEIKKNGVFVRKPGLDLFSDSLGLLVNINRVPWKYLAEFRLEIDSLLTRKAAINATPENITHLEQLLAEGEKILKQKDLDWKKLVEIDLKIHLYIAMIAGNPIYEWMLRIVLDNLMKYYEKAVAEPKNFAIDSFEDMFELVKAIKQGDVEKAVSKIRDHVNITGNKYIDKEFIPDVIPSPEINESEENDGAWVNSEITRQFINKDNKES